MRGPARSLILAVQVLPVALTLVLWSPCASRAQSPQPPPLPPPPRETQGPQNDRHEGVESRHRALDEVERLKNRPRASAEDTRLYSEVAEDFKQLQLSNHSLAQAARPGAQLDYDLIKKQAAEVEKRASRLEARLALPKPDRGRQAGARDKVVTPDGLRPAIASLDALVNSFVGNPYFRRPEVADYEKLSEASDDLAEVIALAKRIRKCAAALAE